MSRCALLRRLAEAERVVQISAPAGSGKTVLLRSWIAEAAVARHAAWVPVDGEERDPQRFWLSVLGALRETAPGAALVGALPTAPDLDGRAIVERLLMDLAPLADRIWLVIDDVHELGPDALRQLELLMMRAPPGLRFVLATRRDVRLGLHRLRLDGELTEIREPNLRFSVAEARELFAAAGVQLPDSAVVMLHEQTEGWAAGLRLAALSLAGHPDPARFAAGFSGSDRTVAEYLLAEVLDRQPEEVRRLLLRTSILERVNGELADLLTGGKGGEQVLLDLEQANAFVNSLDGSRSWFRYHQMFAGLLQLELRRAASDEVAALHRTAADWLAKHGYSVEAIRHAQAAGDWDLAAELLADHWPGLHLDGQAATTHELLAAFPPSVRAVHAGLAAVAAADELAYGSLEAAERYLGLAERGAASAPDGRDVQAQLLVGIVRLLVVRQRGDRLTMAEEVRRLEVLAEAPDTTQPGRGQDLRALALIGLGITEVWTGRFQEAERHLERGVALARRIGRPFLELTGLAHLAPVDALGDRAAAGRALERALDLAEPDGALSLFLLHPAPGLLDHHARHGTAHAALIAEIQTLLAGNRSEPSPGSHVVWAGSRGLDEQLTDSETRVLRYLPTHLTAHEIAGELWVSVNTVSTHRRRLYAKLGVHSRREAVDRGRVLGLLAPSARRTEDHP